MEHPKQGQGFDPEIFLHGGLGDFPGEPPLLTRLGDGWRQNRGLRVDGLLEAPDAVCLAKLSPQLVPGSQKSS